MKNISNFKGFSDSERLLATQTLLERYGRVVPLQIAEAEIEVDPESDDLTNCEVIYWEERGAHFVVFKLAESRFRAQFFYSEAQQYGTGRETFDNLGDCMITLLQVQSDHERQMKGISSGMTATDIGKEYDGPLII